MDGDKGQEKEREKVAQNIRNDIIFNIFNELMKISNKNSAVPFRIIRIKMIFDDSHNFPPTPSVPYISYSVRPQRLI